MQLVADVVVSEFRDQRFQLELTHTKRLSPKHQPGIDGRRVAVSGLSMGGEITTAQILEPEEAAPFARIGLRLSLRGDTATVRDFLYAVETREPMLIVRRMDLGGSGLADNESVENPTLSATFEVYGYAPGAILR